MKPSRLAIEAVVVGVLLMATIMLGLDRATGLTPVQTNTMPPDTTTIERLTRAYDAEHPTRIEATTDITGTKAAILAAGLLLSQPYFVVSLPIIEK